MTTAPHTRIPGQPRETPPIWTPPKISADDLTFRFANSLLDEFVLGHSFDDVLRELVQNEYDASGTQMSVNFGVDALEITGSGGPIDADGWKRLSVMLGTGNIIGDTQQQVAEKINGLGSKNQGLRTLFLFGDKIYVRSDGKQTVLDIRNGALPRPRPDPSSAGSRGVRIMVPYRTQPQGKLEPFTIERERALIDCITTELAPTLIKLPNPRGRHSITSVRVTSKRCGRQLVWNQSVKQIVARGLKGTLLRRRIRTDDSGDGTEQPASPQTIEELEFQRVLSIPTEFRQRNIPAYFVLPARRIRMALSFRMRGKRIDRNQPGHYFYPLGVRDGFTGIALSVCAPFEMNANRSDLIAPEVSPWNHWLLRQAVTMSQELLATDWLVRFGADVYLALFHPEPSPAQPLAYALHAHLGEATCWPTRARQADQPKQPVFAKATYLVVPDIVALDGLLTDRRRYLDDRLGRVADLHKIVDMYGARRFSVNSLVRLRCCADEDAKALKTQLKKKEANYYYDPDGLRSLKVQCKLAAALDAVEQWLSSENKADLRTTQTTLAADGSLAPCESLQAIGSEIAQISPVTLNRRLHPALLSSKVLRKLAKRANPGAWVKDAAAQATSGTIGEQEREALYRYVIQHGMQLSREVRRVLKSAPVLRDQHGAWVAPGRITIPKARGVEQIKAALHLPHPDYASDTALARALFFRKRIEGDDLVAYAQIVAREPQRAADFERFLQRNSKLITDQVARRLQSIAFLAATRGKLSAPVLLYLRNEPNQACLGDSVDYPAGRAASLYKRLGCQLQPRAQDIVIHLAQLRGRGHSPARPEVLYPELVRALTSEGKKATAHEDDPILWTTSGYHRPYDVLLGAKHRAIFEGAVPISDGTNALSQAYQHLGAKTEPQDHHWLALLAWHEQRAGSAGQPPTQEQRRTLHPVYMNIPYHSNFLSQVPNQRRWLLVQFQ